MRVTFASLNLWYGGKLWNAVVSFLQETNADIVALQEATEATDPGQRPTPVRSFAALQAALRYPHGHFAPAFRDLQPAGAVESGNALLSRFPITAATATFFDLPYNPARREARGTLSLTPRNLQHVTLDLGGSVPLHVYNTQGVWDIHGQDNERRIRMAEVIAQEVAGKPRVIVAGDFNVQEGTRAIQTIEEALVSVFRGQLTSSFNLRHKKEQAFATAVVDMVFVSRDLTVVDRRTPDVDVSDHRPLVCVLDVP